MNPGDRAVLPVVTTGVARQADAAAAQLTRVALFLTRGRALPARRLPAQALAALIAMPKCPSPSAAGQMMVWYPGCRRAKVAKPSCVLMSSTSMTLPGGIAAAPLLHLEYRVPGRMQAIVDEHLNMADLDDQRWQPLPARALQK